MVLGALVVLYAVMMVLKPKPVDWTVTLRQDDKNPYGAFIVFQRMGDLFPEATITSEQMPAYNLLSDSALRGTAYVLIAPRTALQPEDVHRLLGYVARGNAAFIATGALSRALSDSLGVKLAAPVEGVFSRDSGRVNFTNTHLRTDSGFTFRQFTLRGYFSEVDTATTSVLGTTGSGQADFISMRRGKGLIYLHAAPLCFSNYFMLFGDNSTYTARALSYLPRHLSRIYWDEYYKLGSGYKGSMLSFFLAHRYLRWAWWLALFGIVMYVVFESRRRQRVIPVADPLDNTSLDFIKTVGQLYYERRDNKNIAEKKVAHFLEWVRSRLYLSTERLDPAFIGSLARKSGRSERAARDLVGLIIQLRSSEAVSDVLLLQLNGRIDAFYSKLSDDGIGKSTAGPAS